MASQKLPLLEHYDMRAYGREEVQLHAFLNLARWKWLVSSMSQSLKPQKRAPIAHWTQNWGGSRARLDALSVFKPQFLGHMTH